MRRFSCATALDFAIALTGRPEFLLIRPSTTFLHSGVPGWPPKLFNSAHRVEELLRVLITGLTGMAGSHLAEALLDREDIEVFGTMRWRSRLDNLDDIAARGRLNTMEGL